MKIKYTGTAHFRDIRVADANLHGVEGVKEDLQWSRGEAIEVPDSVGKWLLEEHSTEFAKVTEPPKGSTSAGKGVIERA